MSNTTVNKQFQVAIVGGGVCGLTCAVALQRAGVQVQLFEAAPAFGEIGAGIGLGTNAVRTLEALGFMDALLEHIKPDVPNSRSFALHFGQGDHEHVYTYETTPEDNGLFIHRAVFLDALVSLLDPTIAHFNKRCVSVTESPAGSTGKSLVVHFQDGTTYEADVVLGADGVKSHVRDFVVGGEKRLKYSNTVAYRGLINYAELQAAGFKTDLSERPVCFVGPNKNETLENQLKFVHPYNLIRIH